MTKTLYITHPDGGISFRSERRPGEVRIPNYVYDLWTPILGISGLGLYAIYVRLEREGVTKGLTTRRLAKLARIGTSKLFELNALLQKYGFISIRRPTGSMRLRHFTSEITVKDPPMTVDLENIDPDDLPAGGYEVLSTWLVGQLDPNWDRRRSEMGSPRLQPFVVESADDDSDSTFREPIDDIPF